MGALSANVVARYTDHLADRAPRELMAGPSAAVLAALVLISLTTAWWPFDVTLDVSTVLERLRASRTAMLSDAASWPELAFKAALFAGIAFLVSRAIRRDTGRLPITAGIGLVIIYAIVLDAGQGLMGSRPAGLETVVWQAMGIAIGAVTASRVSP